LLLNLFFFELGRTHLKFACFLNVTKTYWSLLGNLHFGSSSQLPVIRFYLSLLVFSGHGFPNFFKFQVVIFALLVKSCICVITVLVV